MQGIIFILLIIKTMERILLLWARAVVLHEAFFVKTNENISQPNPRKYVETVIAVFANPDEGHDKSSYRAWLSASVII